MYIYYNHLQTQGRKLVNYDFGLKLEKSIDESWFDKDV